MQESIHSKFHQLGSLHLLVYSLCLLKEKNHAQECLSQTCEVETAVAYLRHHCIPYQIENKYNCCMLLFTAEANFSMHY